MNQILYRIYKALKDPRYVSWKFQTYIAKRFRVTMSRFRRSKPDCEPEKNVCMIHIGRSGSTALADLLYQHPAIHWEGEVWQDMINSGADRGHHPEEFFDFLSHRHSLASGKVFGYEMKFFHMENLGDTIVHKLAALESRGDTAFIVLERKNYLKKVISSVKASSTTRWHQPPGTDAPREELVLNPDDIFIDGRPTALKPLLESYHSNFVALKEALQGRPYLWLTYEGDFDQSPLQAYEKVIEFLGLPPHPVKVRYGKTNPYPVKGILKDYEAVQAALKNSQFEWMLHE